MNERDFTKKVMTYLKKCENLHPIRIIPGPHGGMKGTSDILACCDGHFVAIELKVGTGRATKLQNHFMKQIKDAGGSAYVCRSLQDVKNIIKTRR